MNETKYAVGVDIGTETVRVVVGNKDMGAVENKVTIVGVGAQKNGGMRKGMIIDPNKTAEAIDKALETAERMSGHQIDHATVSINGSHINGLASKGIIALGANKTVDHEEIRRVEEAATVVQMPANREILDVTPRSYKLDSQDGIRDPLGMTGVRLEVDAYMITALAPNVKSLEKVLSMVELSSRQMIVPSLAASRTVLTDQLRDSGVVLIDMGAATTNIAVFEENDIIHIAVLPVGANNITNDLAIGLRTDLDIAEKIKIEYAVASPSYRRGSGENLTVKVGSGADVHTLEFNTAIIDEIVEARLEEIFEMINHELKKIKRLAKLPGGAVLTGGGARLKGIADYAREALSMNAHVIAPHGFNGVIDQITTPEYSTAVGLMLIDMDSAPVENKKSGLFGGLLSLFKKRK
ncbi:cell division protein FtsA [Candidatus Saccharibacteria bacterium]|nr:cell division protein FtsA [Candidatus Saccharibacteria bacterium]MCL1963371.1 cell division protein FtsA [Candidatus Saccharibacteria bacterium]